MPFITEFGFCAAAFMTVYTYGPAVVKRLRRVPPIARAHARLQAAIRRRRRF